MASPPGASSAAACVSVACLVATLAFWAYTRTLVPGVEPGDSGGFQAAVLWPEVSARQAYPLYYVLARPFVLATAPDNAARALNLFSAVSAAAAVGILVLACAWVTGSAIGGAAAGLFLAFSYTFWSQAIIAEVYALHLALIGLCLLALYAYERRPTTVRLALFFAVYALSFGNHLGMVLLLVPITAFLLRTPDRRLALLTPRIIALAVAIAAAGSLQYLPNLMATWVSADAPPGWLDRLALFWTDATKADWRQTMVLGVPPAMAVERLAMWWFDIRQQFGIAGVALAAAGLAWLWRERRAWAALLLGIFAIASVFALTYNVGDVHVFFLPAHYVMAFFAGAAVAALARTHSRPGRTSTVGLPGWASAGHEGPRRMSAAALVVLSLAYAGWRGWDTWPAVDRHDDRRGEQLITRLTLGVSDRDAVLVSRMDWQLENVLLYLSRWERPELAWLPLDMVRDRLPQLVQDNRRLSRDVVLTAEAAVEVVNAYTPLLPVVEDAGLPALGLSEVAGRIPIGAPYVLCLLTPPSDEYLDPELLADALATLTGGRAPAVTGAAFEMFAGVAGEAPAVHRASDQPFRARLSLLGEPFTVRMESWLPFDTFRRAGFGQVLHGRQRILIVERGVNLVWLDTDGPSAPFYAASLMAPKPRYRIPATTVELAGLSSFRPLPGFRDWNKP